MAGRYLPRNPKPQGSQAVQSGEAFFPVDETATLDSVDVVETKFPYVEIPKELGKVVGEPDKGTRCYYNEGSEEAAGEWFEAIDKHLRSPCVSPGGVSMFAPVTRAGVHKRLKEGRLTAFFFQVTHITTTFWGGKRKVRQTPYCLIPVSECKVWGRQLRRRGVTKDEDSWTPEQKRQFEKWAKKNELLACLGSTPLPWEGEDAWPGFLDEGDKAKRERARQAYLKKHGGEKK